MCLAELCKEPPSASTSRKAPTDVGAFFVPTFRPTQIQHRHRAHTLPMSVGIDLATEGHQNGVLQPSCRPVLVLTDHKHVTPAGRVTSAPAPWDAKRASHTSWRPHSEPDTRQPGLYCRP